MKSKTSVPMKTTKKKDSFDNLMDELKRIEKKKNELDQEIIKLSIILAVMNAERKYKTRK